MTTKIIQLNRQSLLTAHRLYSMQSAEYAIANLSSFCQINNKKLYKLIKHTHRSNENIEHVK